MAAPSEPVRSLFVTLRRGLAGKPENHRRILAALGLKHPHQCVEKPNNDMIRGMLAKASVQQRLACFSSSSGIDAHNPAAPRGGVRRGRGARTGATLVPSTMSQVPHLVLVETDRMFFLRTVKEQLQRAPRPPIVVHHPEAAAHATLPPVDIPTLPPPPPPGPPPRPRAVPAPVTPASLALQLLPGGAAAAHQPHPSHQQQPPAVARPLQSPLLAPHLAEHMAPLPDGGKGARYARAARRPLKEELQQLVARRADAINRKGLYSQEVAQLNQRIAAARAEQVRRAPVVRSGRVHQPFFSDAPFGSGLASATPSLYGRREVRLYGKLTKPWSACTCERVPQVQEEEAHRRAVLEAKHTPGPHRAKVHAAGKGSRRGMLAEARAQAAARQAQRQQRLAELQPGGEAP